MTAAEFRRHAAYDGPAEVEQLPSVIGFASSHEEPWTEEDEDE